MLGSHARATLYSELGAHRASRRYRYHIDA